MFQYSFNLYVRHLKPSGGLLEPSIVHELFFSWLAYAWADPGDQLKWLASELQSAEANGEKVFILMHMGGGNFGQTYGPWGREFSKLVDRFEGTIIAQGGNSMHIIESVKIIAMKNVIKISELALNV